MAGVASIVVAICSRVAFLAICNLMTKAQFGTVSVGLSGEPKEFRRPMFMNLTAQVALLLAGCLGGAVKRLATRLADGAQEEEETSHAARCLEEGRDLRLPAKQRDTRFVVRSMPSESTETPSDMESVSAGSGDDSDAATTVSSGDVPLAAEGLTAAAAELGEARPDEDLGEAQDAAAPAASPSMPAGFTGRVLRIGVVSAMSMAGGVVGSAALLFLPTSIWQLSQASGILFTAVLARLCLGQRLTLVRRLGVAICVAGVALASASDILDVESTSLRDALLGIALALLSQALGAATAVAEEHLLKSVAVPPLQLIAWEGAWGVTLTLFVVYPLMHFLPSNQGSLFDDVVMLANNPELLAVQGLLLLAMMGSGVSGIVVTALLSSVHRKMLNISVGAIVWAAALVTHYCIDASAVFGEAWNEDSLLELAGFLLIAAGQATYGGLLRCGRHPGEGKVTAQDLPERSSRIAGEDAATTAAAVRGESGTAAPMASAAAVGGRAATGADAV